MSPETPMFGRLTHGAKRINLGRAPIHILMTRAIEQMRNFRKQDEMIIQLEFGTSKLMDSTTFDRAAIQEQEFVTQVITDMDAESPFPGITIGRVSEAMSSPEYEAYARVCEPVGRQGLNSAEVELIRFNYQSKFEDCFPHFPKWVES